MKRLVAPVLCVVLFGSGCSVAEVQAWFRLNLDQPLTAAEATHVAENVNVYVADGCDENYVGDCVPVNATDVDCVGSGDGPEWAEGPLLVRGWDHYGLDPDGDLVACDADTPPVEPPSGTTPTTTTTTTTPTTTTTTTTTSPPTPSSTAPLLLVTDSLDPFSSYLEEILTAEGLTSFTSMDLGSVNSGTLNQFDVVVLGNVAVSGSQASMFESWVNSGGDLIAMRPDGDLSGLLGVSPTGSTLSDAWLAIDTSTGPGVGLVDASIQFHGTADRYSLNGATAVATLYSGQFSPTSNPAVTTRSVGGGSASGFMFDLSRSVVLTRQGNPAWAGRNVDGVDGFQATEMFFGANGDPDWNNLDQALIPIADEQQRLLANMITRAAATAKPLPRLWYLPRELKAAIVMTGDDHATGGTGPRFDRYLSQSPSGCDVDQWECIRASSYLFPFNNSSFPQISNSEAVAYENQGFEVGVHITTNCQPWGSPQNLYDLYSFQVGAFSQFMPGVSGPSSTRTHCVEWDDWSTHAEVKEAFGIRLDTDYYYYPATWTQNRPGYFNGTAMPMRYARLDGSVIDVYQATTQVSDESGHDVGAAVTAMLDGAQGPDGFYTVITANEHTDSTCGSCEAQSDAIVSIAQARGVPIVSGRQMLEWLDARNASSFESISWSGTDLTFDIAGGATGLTGMLPVDSGSGTLASIRRGGSNVSYTVETIKGINYALFPANTGNHTATYGN